MGRRTRSHPPPAGRLSTALLLLAAALAGCRPPGQRLHVLADADVESLDPHASGGRFAARNVLANAYEGLVARDADLRLRPALAVSWTNPDDHTWEFVLRQGVRFHDGSVLTEADVVGSIRRAQQHPRSAVRGDLANLADATSPGAGRVRLKTREPDAALLSLLPGVFVLSGAAARANTDVAEGSLGTGPYRVASRVPGTSIDLEAFDAYWGGAPPLRSVRVLPYAYGSPEAERAVPRGAPLLFFAPPGSPEFGRAAAEHAAHERASLSVQYLGFDLRPRESPGVRLPDGARGNPFRDRHVRQAIALAVDYEKLRAGVLAGRTRVASQVVPPEVLGFDPTLPEPRHDLQQARRLMAESAYPHGFEVDLDLREFVGQQFAPHLLDALGGLGIRARVRPFGEQGFFDHLRAGRSSLYLLRFTVRTGDAQEFFDKMVHSKDEPRGLGAFNFSYETSPVPQLDERIEGARRTIHPAERLGRLQEVMRIVVGERIVVPLLAERNVTFLSRSVEWTPRADGLRLFAEMREVR